MAYQITEQTWLTRAVERVKGSLIVHMAHGIAYEAADLKALAASKGLDYTDAEFVQIRDALVADGTIEQV